MAKQPLKRPEGTLVHSTGEHERPLNRQFYSISRGLYDDGECVLAPDYDDGKNSAIERMMRDNRAAGL